MISTSLGTQVLTGRDWPCRRSPERRGLPAHLLWPGAGSDGCFSTSDTTPWSCAWIGATGSPSACGAARALVRSISLAGARSGGSRCRVRARPGRIASATPKAVLRWLPRAGQMGGEEDGFPATRMPPIAMSQLCCPAAGGSNDGAAPASPRSRSAAPPRWATAPATRFIKVRAVSAATRCKITRSRPSPAAPSGGR
jgi:hypothetical protein